MEVKIYREPENEKLILNEDELLKYDNLISELNIETEAEKGYVPSVYVPLNISMVKLLKALCPASVDIKKYNKSTIPVEVLEVAKYAIDNKMFDGLEIWYADKDPDPLLIGWKYRSENDRVNKYTWSVNYQILARWGDEALELPELLKRGFKSLKISLIDSANKVVIASKNILENPDMYVRKHLKGDLTLPKLNIEGGSTIGELPF